MRQAERVLRKEHLALKGVYRVLRIEAKMLREGHSPDFPVLEAIVEYIREFPDRIHHPKEEQYVFRLMRERSPESANLLDELFREHEQEDRLIGELQQTLLTFKQDPARHRDSFVDIAECYADFLEHHLATEDKRAFPLAKRVLTEEDWDEIDRGFADNDDPLAGGTSTDRFTQLHHKILSLATLPMAAAKDQR